MPLITPILPPRPIAARGSPPLLPVVTPATGVGPGGL